MIGVVDVKIQAANPSMPLYPMRAFIGSPSSIRVREVPKKIGDWQITKVYFTAAYPDDSIKTAECVLVGGVYVGTIAGSSVSGTSTNGYTIFADGTDENGNEVHGYVLGKGDIQILEADGTITPSEEGTKYYVHLLSAQAATPNDGDMWQDDGSWYIWQDGQAQLIGDDSCAIAELSGKVDELSADLPSKQDALTEPEMHAIDDYVDVLATKFTFYDGSVSAFNWSNSEVTFQDFIDAGLVDEYNEWVKQPRHIEIGKDVNSFYADAFINCYELTSVIFNDKMAVGYGINPNYPWGISDTSIIQPAYNATRYWVQQQGYGFTYPYANAFISPMGVRKSTLQPYKVNQLTITSQAASFRIDVSGSTGKMRDLYFVLTVPTDTQPITWNTYFDKFAGGNADAIAPKSGVNIYHIYEYASGHFAVERFDNALYNTNVTYAELVALKNQSKLTPGMMYTITDYATTTTQTDTEATGQVLPIVVKAATSADIDPMGYMPSKKCQIRYCIDNDTGRFAWADTANGKGVIYWMRDPHGNECPYDFKSIKFKPFDPTSTPNTNMFYTFSYLYSNVPQDASEAGYAQNNIILPAYTVVGQATASDTQKLNNIIIVSGLGKGGGNYFCQNCYDISLGLVSDQNNVGNWFGPACFRIYSRGYFAHNFLEGTNNRLYFGYCHNQERFGKTVSNITFGNSIDDLKSYFLFNTYDGPILGLNITSSQTTSTANAIRGNIFGKYLSYTTGTNPTLDIGIIGQDYEVDYKRTGSQTITFN